MNSTTASRIVFAAICLLTAADCLAAGEGPRPPAPPKVFLASSVASTPVTGETIEVGPGCDFQAALNKAQPGDEIVLQAGATYTGNFTLPCKEGSGKWITIRTSNMAGLPKEGMQVSPKHPATMAKIVERSPGRHVVDRERERRADELVEPRLAQPDHPRHLPDAHGLLFDTHWT